MKSISSPNITFSPLADEALCVLSRHLIEKGHRFLLVGATARDILIYHYNLPAAGSATKDIDIGLSLDKWNSYEAFKTELLCIATFEGISSTKFLYKRSIKIDILPYGKICDENSFLEIPGEDRKMNMIGFEDAYESSISYKINADTEFRIPNIPGIVAMKLISWNDRPEERNNDARDVLYFIMNYGQSGNNTDRLWNTKDLNLMEKEGFDIDLAGMRLLGMDMSAMLTDKTYKTLHDIINRELNRGVDSRLVQQFTGTGNIYYDDLFSRNMTFLEKLFLGFIEHKR